MVGEKRFELATDETGHLEIAVGSLLIASYHYRHEAPASESPKPYLHPVRALNGSLASVYRPADHRWHKGLQMTWSEISGQNFWGGPTFDPAAPGNGYIWRDNIGRQRHDGFSTVDCDGDEVRVVELLTWITQAGEEWLTERRTIRFHSLDNEFGAWSLDLRAELTNVRGETLRLGSPTTLGRPAAGYTGLFWRGPRSWTGSPFHIAGGLEGDPMGTRAPWVAIGGEDDESDGSATVLMHEARADRGTGSVWFARSEPFAALSPSPAFADVIDLADTETLTVDNRVVVFSGLPDAARLGAYAGRSDW